MRNNSTNHSRGIIDSTWGRVPGLHAHSEAEAILEQRLLFVSLCEARMAFTRLWWIIVRIIPEASLTAPEDECLGLHAYSEAEAILEQRLLFVSLCEARMAFTRLWGIIVRNHSRGIIDSTRGRVPGLHAYSEAEAILEQRLLFVSLCEARMAFTRLWGIIYESFQRHHWQHLRTSAWLACSLGCGGHTWATIALCFIVWGKDGLHKTIRNNGTNHSRGIIDSTWGRVPGLHAYSEAEAILEQRLLFVSLCEARMAFTRLWGIIVRIIPEASLTAPGGRVPGLHAYSEAEAILEQGLLFVSLCEARMAFTRLWGIIVRIIPEASLTAPEDECLACMLTRKRRPYLSNDCSLFHCVRQGWPSQDYEE